MLTVKQNVLQLAKEARFNEVDHENGNCLHCIVKSLWLRKSFNLMLIIGQAKIKESQILDTKSSKEISDHADKILVDTSWVSSWYEKTPHINRWPGAEKLQVKWTVHPFLVS